MTIDLWMLVCAAALQWALIMTEAAPSLLKKGLPWGLGNRDEAPVLVGWHARAHRANANLQENLILFAILVLAAAASGKANETTALGAQIFFWARVGHAVVYIAGISVVRTLLWTVSIVGMVMIALQIV